MAKEGEVPTNNIYSRLRQYFTIYDSDMKVMRLGKKNFTLLNRIRSNVTSEAWKIEAKYEYRPDNISNLHYGTPYLFWVIMGYNYLWHPKDFYVDRSILIPDYNTLIGILI